MSFLSLCSNILVFLLPVDWQVFNTVSQIINSLKMQYHLVLIVRENIHSLLLL